MNTIEIKLEKEFGRPPTAEEVSQYKRESYLKHREKMYAWRNKKKEEDPEYWPKYLKQCKEWHKNRQERRGRTIRIQPSYKTEEERISAKKASQQRYNEKHPERRREQWRKFARNNKHKALAYQKMKRATDPIFSMAVKLRKRLRAALYLADANKTQSASDLVGCTMPELKQHLESQFTEGMSWDLFCTGAIHIDHDVPCASFDLTKEDQQKACFHYTNLKPSWPKDNLSKSSIYNGKRWYYRDHMQAPAQTV